MNQTDTLPRRIRQLIVFLFTSGLLAVVNSHAQPLTTEQQTRVSQLYSQIERSLLLPIPPPASCPVPALQQAILTESVRMDIWLNRALSIQADGDSLCAAQVVNLLRPIAQHNPATYRHWLLTRISMLELSRQPRPALAFVNELEQGSQADRQTLGRAFYEKAKVLNQLIQYEEALRVGNEAVRIARTEHDQQLEANALMILGHTSRNIYRQTPAKYLPYLQQAAEIARTVNDSTALLNIYRSLAYAHMYDETADLTAILTYLESSIPYLSKQPDFLQRYKFIWAFADGLSYFNSTQNKANYLYLNLLIQAKRFRRTLDIRTLYQYLSQLAINRKEFLKAGAYLDSAARYTTPDWEKDHFYQQQAVVQEALGNIQVANSYYQKALAEKENVYLRRNNQSMTHWETQFRTREKELQIAQHQQQRLLLLGIILLVSLLLGVAVFAFFRNRHQLRLLARQNAIIEEQSVALQSLDKAKTRFFANITHEFRTPLTLILSPLDELITEIPQRPILKTIQANATRLLVLINQLLDLSKLDAGVVQTSPRQENLALFMQQQEETFRGLAEKRQVTLTFSELSTHTELMFDGDKLSKILTNLLGNALKFTPEGGRVSVQTTIIDSNQDINSSQSGHLKIQIADTGSGIPVDKLPHIFDRFYQADDASSRLFEGSGIGLSLVKELVDVLKGTIQVESVSGKGTRFNLTLPVEKATKELLEADTLPYEHLPNSLAFQPTLSQPTNERIVIDGTKPIVLVVEDNDELCAYIATLFADQYNVATATDGQEGLKVALDLIPDLVITDWMMPRMDGVTLCRELKADLRTSHIPVLMLTAKAALDSRLGSFESGADSHITKPFHARELTLKVQNWLTRQQQLRQRYQEQLTRPDQPLPIPEGEPVFIQRAVDLIDQHLIDPLFDVEQLADVLSMNRRTLHRKLLALTGLPPSEFIRNHRLQRSLHHLKQGKPIADVAFLVGFQTPSYFSKCFREVYGQRPSDIPLETS